MVSSRLKVQMVPCVLVMRYMDMVSHKSTKSCVKVIELLIPSRCWIGFKIFNRTKIMSCSSYPDKFNQKAKLIMYVEKSKTVSCFFERCHIPNIPKKVNNVQRVVITYCIWLNTFLFCNNSKRMSI